MSINKLHLNAITTTIDNKQECSIWRRENEARERVSTITRCPSLRFLCKSSKIQDL